MTETTATQITEMWPLPQGWEGTTLGEVSLVNPRSFIQPPEENQPVSFVPMAAVEAGTGKADVSQERPYREVRKGYTPFSEGDVLFAKITPCMENGKIAVAQGLTNGAGCGSTEFHVLRPLGAVPSELVMYFLLQEEFRKEAQRRMAGTAGQLRVPAWFVTDAAFPLPPLPEQHRIVAEIEKQFTRLDASVAALKRAQTNLKRYRASVLKAACEGKLVPAEAELARQEGRDYEPASALLERVLKERHARWETQEKRRGVYKDPAAPDISTLPELPEGWVWATWDQVGLSKNGRAFPSKEYGVQGVRLLRPGNLNENGRVVWTEENTRYLPEKWADDFPDYLIGQNELVMNLTAQSLRDEFLGRVCITGEDDQCLLNQRLALLIPILVDEHFLLWMFKSRVFRNFVNGLNTGSLIQHMFTSQLQSFAFALPPLAEQRRIVAEVERHLSVIQAAENIVAANLKRSERLRQSILKQAFSGKLVPQDPNDEPASALLERIRAERAAVEASPKARQPRRGASRRHQMELPEVK